MTLKRMNNLLMSVYEEEADNLNLIDVANNFYTGNFHVVQIWTLFRSRPTLNI